MIRCERCGTGFNPLQAAVLAFCPRCLARDRVKVALVTRLVKDGPARHPEVGPGASPRS